MVLQHVRRSDLLPLLIPLLPIMFINVIIIFPRVHVWCALRDAAHSLRAPLCGSRFFTHLTHASHVPRRIPHIPVFLMVRSIGSLEHYYRVLLSADWSQNYVLDFMESLLAGGVELSTGCLLLE